LAPLLQTLQLPSLLLQPVVLVVMVLLCGGLFHLPVLAHLRVLPLLLLCCVLV
jgi:hypothetical protein